MRRLAVLLLLLVACASTPSRKDAPDVALQLGFTNSPSDTLYFSGPVNVQLALTMRNPSNEQLTLRRLELRSTSGPSFFLRATSANFNVPLAPHETKTVNMSVWGYSRGGYLAQDAPIQIQGAATFDSTKGPFFRIFSQILSPR